jgi:hypothetical protein
MSGRRTLAGDQVELIVTVEIHNGDDTRALQAYLDHRNIQHTVRYTELSPMRFKDFCRTMTLTSIDVRL